MRRVFAALLLATLTLLPAIDAVYCPDGCSDTDRAAFAWKSELSDSQPQCGLCQNAVAVDTAVARVDPQPTPVAIMPATRSIFISGTPDAVDRPPRRS